MKTPKQLFLEDKDAVHWWQSVVDDHRFKHIAFLCELQVMRGLQDTVNPNVMMANDAVRVGSKRALITLATFADASGKSVDFEIPAVLHDPDRAVPNR